MKTKYSSESKHINISLTPREANILQEILSEYYATVPAGYHSTFAYRLDGTLLRLPAVIQYWRNGR